MYAVRRGRRYGMCNLKHQHEGYMNFQVALSGSRATMREGRGGAQKPRIYPRVVAHEGVMKFWEKGRDGWPWKKLKELESPWSV